MGCNYDNIICTIPLPRMSGRNPVIWFQSKDLIQDMQRIIIAPDGKLWHQEVDYLDGFNLTGGNERYNFSGTFEMYGDSNEDSEYRYWYVYECITEEGLVTDIGLKEKKVTKYD